MAPNPTFHKGTEAVANSGSGSTLPYSTELYDAGLAIESVLFGFCLATVSLCLYYMIRRWNGKRSDWIIMTFMLLLLCYNIVLFAINLNGTLNLFHFILGFFQDPEVTTLVYHRASLGFEIAFLPTFLWISDAFLIWRASIVWMDHKWVLILPSAVWIASIVTGIVWSIQGTAVIVRDIIGGTGQSTHLADAVTDWIPALAFSAGMDCITTFLIAGRLIALHVRQIKMGASGRYLSVVAIFIESAMLSAISKFLQLFVPGIKIYSYAVVPLCTIASSLILLRKALGADVGSIGALIDREKESGFSSSTRPTFGHRRLASSSSGGSTVFGSASYLGHKHTLSTQTQTKTLPDVFEEDLRQAVGLPDLERQAEPSDREKTRTPESPHMDEKVQE